MATPSGPLSAAHASANPSTASPAPSVPAATDNRKGTPTVTALQNLATQTATRASSRASSSAPPAASPQTGPESSGENAQAQDDGGLGLFKDGRVKDPVPSKLKGQTDNKKGKFGVMLMGLKSKPEAVERDAAAKRTSEGTEAAARKAFANGYISLKRSKLLHNPHPDEDTPITTTTTSTPPPPIFPPPPGEPAPAPNGWQNPKPKTKTKPRTLSPEEIKAEQTRLLALIRSLEPVSVVNQICKALAFFGGVPGGPPPPDGVFPDSALANGSGSLFVSWIAEIFPNLDGGGPVLTMTPPGQAAARAESVLKKLAEVKRPRGRPKGSKSSKTRVDKGIKKGSKRGLLGAGAGLAQGGGNADESWVDDDDGVPNATEGSTPFRSSQPNRPTFHTPIPGSTPPNDLTASGKKRGRPKGSRNRPKDDSAADGSTAPVVIHAPAAVDSGLFSIGKKKGRPKGSKNRPKETHPQDGAGKAPDDASANKPEQASSQAPIVVDDDSFAGTDNALAALRQALEAPLDTNTQSIGFQAVNAVASSLAAKSRTPLATTAPDPEAQTSTKKRKRKSAKNDDGPQAVSSGDAVTNHKQTTPAPVSQTATVSASNTSQTVDLTTPAPPAAKRQRKSKDPKGSPAKNQESAKKAGASAATPAPKSVQIPPNTGPSVQQPELTSPTIEELEAQLEEPSPSPELQHSIPPRRQPVQQAQPVKNDQRQTMAARQPRQQQQYQQQQKQQQAVAQTASPALSQVNVASSNIGQARTASPSLSQVHSASPSLTQQSMAKSQAPSSVASQAQSQQVRNAQSYYSQNRSTQPQYGQQQAQATQKYSAQPQQGYSPQQQPKYTSQQQKQPTYSSQPQQYSSQQQQQQQYSSQQTLQQPPQFAATSATATPQTLAHQSPQFGASTPSYTTGDGSFRSGSGTAMSYGNSSFGARRTPASASQANNSYQSNGGSYTSSAQHSSSYSNRTAPPASSSTRNPVQNVQGMPQNLSQFQNFTDTSGLFDMSNLDTSGAGQNTLNLNGTSYGMGGGNVSRPPGNTGTYNTSGIPNFDTSLGGNDRFFNVQRR